MNTKNKFDITAITVCVNYAHLFKHCINNKRFFKRWVIVTTSKDKDTIKLCEDNNLEFLICDEIYDRTFFKSRAINRALELVGLKEDWYLFIDSDILLPDNFFDFVIDGRIYGKEKLKGGINYIEKKYKQIKALANVSSDIKEGPSENDIFTMGRINVFDNEDFSNFDPQAYFDLPERVRGQFLAYGYFQLFHMPKFLKTYDKLHYVHPELSKNAGHDDWIFRNMFNKVVCLDQYCLHLSQEGINWDGINN
tara:strand:- start:1078 stop:1830 length:753 start_codon:yes stop_codon:yes gene_type:complete